VFATVFLPDIPNRKVCASGEVGYNRSGIVGAAIIDNDPLEIAKSLAPK
jgi:hypothetical protein